MIGYFISTSKLNSLKKGTTDSVYERFLESVSALGGKAFLFSINDINWNDLTMIGYYFIENKLAQEIFPLPKIIYNRCFGAKAPQETEQLITKLKIFTGIKLVNPIIKQEEIEKVVDIKKLAKKDCVTILGLPAEVHVLMQKNQYGVWQLTGASVSVLSQPTTDGLEKKVGYLPCIPALQDMFPNTFNKVINALKARAFESCKRLDPLSAYFAEISLVYCIDKAGTPCVQKISTKPLKTFVTHFKGSPMAELCILRPAYYCAMLAGYPLTSVDTFTNQSTPTTIGIFEAEDDIDCLKNQNPYFHQTKLAQASMSLKCRCFHFSVKDIKRNKRLYGWFYNKSLRKWQARDFAWPKVLYDRAAFNDETVRTAAKNFRKEIKAEGNTLLINSRTVFGKGYTIAVLSRNPELAPYLPYTKSNPDRTEVSELLSKCYNIFLKTEYGSRSIGVAEASFKNGIYTFKTYTKEMQFASFEAFWSYLMEFMKDTPFVAQTGIPSITLDNEVINIRAILQKNGLGLWQMTLINPWTARTIDKPPVPLPWKETMQAIFKSSLKVEEVAKQANKVSLMVAKTLDAYDGPLGELGLDLVIDNLGHPWIIEVNGKSAKSFFAEALDEKSALELYTTPLAYGIFLAQANNHGAL